MSRARNLERIVTGVVRQALEDAGADGIVLADDGSAEADLLAGWFSRAFGTRFHRVPGAGPDGAAKLQDARARAQQLAAAQSLLPAAPINKTTLLLALLPVPETLLPLGDLYATEVRELAGDWRGAPIVYTLKGLCGGIEVLDEALRARFDERQPLPAVLSRLPEPARQPLAQALERGRFARNRVGIVPKIGSRTAGIDLFA